MIRDAVDRDAEALARIYNYYIEHSPATFEETLLDVEAFRGRMAAVREQGLPWLVAEEGEALIGYAYASRWRERSAYRFSVESTVYLAPDCSGGGWGTTGGNTGGQRQGWGSGWQAQCCHSCQCSNASEASRHEQKRKVPTPTGHRGPQGPVGATWVDVYASAGYEGINRRDESAVRILVTGLKQLPNATLLLKQLAAHYTLLNRIGKTSLTRRRGA